MFGRLGDLFDLVVQALLSHRGRAARRARGADGAQEVEGTARAGAGAVLSGPGALPFPAVGRAVGDLLRPLACAQTDREDPDDLGRRAPLGMFPLWMPRA